MVHDDDKSTPLLQSNALMRVENISIAVKDAGDLGSDFVKKLRRLAGRISEWLRNLGVTLAIALTIVFFIGIVNTFAFNMRTFNYDNKSSRAFFYEDGCATFPQNQNVQLYFGWGNVSLVADPSASSGGGGGGNRSSVGARVPAGFEACIIPMTPTNDTSNHTSPSSGAGASGDNVSPPTGCMWIDQSGHRIDMPTSIASQTQQLIGTEMLVSLLFFIFFRFDMKSTGISRARYFFGFLMSGIVSYSFRHLGYVTSGDSCSFITSVQYSSFMLNSVIPSTLFVLALYPVMLLTMGTKIKIRQRIELRIGRTYPVVARYAFNVLLTCSLFYFLLLPSVVLGVYNIVKSVRGSLGEIIRVGFVSWANYNLMRDTGTFTIYVFATALQNLTVCIDILVLITRIIGMKPLSDGEADEKEVVRKPFADELVALYRTLETIHFLIRDVIDTIFIRFFESAKRVRDMLALINVLAVVILGVMFVICIGSAFDQPLRSFRFGDSPHMFGFIEGCSQFPGPSRANAEINAFYGLGETGNGSMPVCPSANSTMVTVAVVTNGTRTAYDELPCASSLVRSDSVLNSEILVHQLFTFVPWVYARYMITRISFSSSPSTLRYFCVSAVANVFIYPFKNLGYVTKTSDCSWIWASDYSGIYAEFIPSFLVVIVLYFLSVWCIGVRREDASHGKNHEYITFMCCPNSQYGRIAFNFVWVPFTLCYTILLPMIMLAFFSAAHRPHAVSAFHAFFQTLFVTLPFDYAGQKMGVFFATAIMQLIVLIIDCLFMFFNTGIRTAEALTRSNELADSENRKLFKDLSDAPPQPIPI